MQSLNKLSFDYSNSHFVIKLSWDNDGDFGDSGGQVASSLGWDAFGASQINRILHWLQMNLAFQYLIRVSFVNIMAPKRSVKPLLQNFRHNDKDAIFVQARIGLLGFSSWKCVNHNHRKKRWENCTIGNPTYLVWSYNYTIIQILSLIYDQDVKVAIIQ